MNSTPLDSMRRAPRRPLLFLALLAIAGLGFLHAENPANVPPTSAQAQKFYAEKSFAQAADAWQAIEQTEHPAADSPAARELAFRIADARWRALTAAGEGDESAYAPAVKTLRRLSDLPESILSRRFDGDSEPAKNNLIIGDVWRARAAQSLGEFYTAGNPYAYGRHGGSPSPADEPWPYFQLALSWWSAQPDSTEARDGFWSAFRELRKPIQEQRIPNPGWIVPFAETAQRLARGPEEKAFAQEALAILLTQTQNGASPAFARRVRDAFEAAVAAGPASGILDEVLHRYGQWLEYGGALIENNAGGYQNVPDPDAAVRIYTRLVEEFPKGKSQYFEQVQAQLKALTKSSISFGAEQHFFPGSRLSFDLNVRNEKKLQVTLRKLDLAAAFAGIDRDQSRIVAPPASALGPVLATKTVETQPARPREFWRGKVGFDAVPPGAYWLEARGADSPAGAVFLVTNLALSTQSLPKRELLFAADATTGAPLADAKLTVLDFFRDNSSSARDLKVVRHDFISDARGLAFAPETDVPPKSYRVNRVVIAEKGDQCAFLDPRGGYGSGSENRLGMRAFVYTDRPAYRPGETVFFKIVHRLLQADGYANPAAKLRLRLFNPRGEKILEREAATDEFGTLAEQFVIPADAPLGVFRLEMTSLSEIPRGESASASAELFRLEEYKLPEFKVEVKLPEKDSKPVVFRLGEKVKAEVRVKYYSGGAVPNATVEYSIRQTPFTGENPWPQPYPWLYQDLHTNAGWLRRSTMPGRGQASIVKTGRATTDAEGRASITFDTPQPGPGSGDGFSFAVEARVTDASRRLVEGTGRVKVTARSFQIHLRPEAQLYRPGDTAKIALKALDPNGNPVAFEGTAIIAREREVMKYRKPRRGGQEQLVSRGREAVEVERRAVKTDAQGLARIDFKPKDDGFYRVRVVTPAEPVAVAPGRQPLIAAGTIPPERINGATGVYVAGAATTHLGLRFGALQIVPDKVTYRAGDTARLVLLGPDAGGYVLLTALGDDLVSSEIVKLEGQAKVVEIPIRENAQPNLFFQALMIREGAALTASEEVVVPPDEHFLTLDLTPESGEVRPGSKSRLRLRATDREGKPVRAQVSLSVADAALDYIQADMTGDIREFFFGEKRQQPAPAASSVAAHRLIRLEPETEAEESEEIIRSGPFPHEEALGVIDQEGIYVDSDAAGVVLSGYADSSYAFKMKAGGAIRQLSASFSDVSSALSASPAPQSRPRRERRRDESLEMKSAALPADKLAESEESARDFSQITVRSDFRASAFWQPALLTGTNGEASVEVPYPDTLTDWKASARAVTAGEQFGQGEARVRAALPLMVRLQTPRFLVEGDRVTLSAVLNNETARPLRVATKLEATRLSTVPPAPAASLTVPPHAQARLDGLYDVKEAHGEAEVSVAAKAGADGDAMKRAIPLLEHGLDQFAARSEVATVGTPAAGGAKAKPGEAALDLNLKLPDAFRPGSVKLRLFLAPSLASTCLNALPYLMRYPYGCVEQTMSRFLPAAVAARTLEELKLDPSVVAERIFGGIDPATAKATHRGGKGDLTRLDDALAKGVARLVDMRHADGGWGWWKGDKTDDYMTAYVVQGLALGRRAGTKGIPVDLIGNGAAYLEKQLVDYADKPDMAAWLLQAVALSDRPWSSYARKAADRAWEERERLTPYGRSLLALALHERARDEAAYAERARVLIRNLENGVRETKAESALIGPGGSATMPVTAHWGETGFYYHWRDGAVETTATALRAMLAVDPSHPRIDQAARWLINNRRGTQWTNTRDTALVILSLLEYMKKTGEIDPDLKVEITVSGQAVSSPRFGPAEALGAVTIDVPEKLLRAGDNAVRLRLTGSGRLYASAFLSYFTRENPIAASGNEIYVKREYARETQVVTLADGVKTVRKPLRDGDEIKSGDLIAVRLLIEAKNDYEYLLLEDLRAAGCEATEVRSGEYLTARAKNAAGLYEGAATSVYPEWRDQFAAFFFTKLAQGEHELKYTLRAETPGRFSALPSKIHAMYVPEIRANGDEAKVLIREAK